MKITHGSNVLAEDAKLIWSSGMRVDTSLEVQTTQGLRAAYAKHRARGNMQNSVSFTVTRRHDSVEEAEEFYLSHAQEVSGKADANFECGEPGDTEVLSMNGANLHVSAISRRGVTTTHTYLLAGGEIASL